MSGVRNTPRLARTRAGVPVGVLAAWTAGLGGAGCSFDGASHFGAGLSPDVADAADEPTPRADAAPGDPDAAPPAPDAPAPDPTGLVAPFTTSPPIADGDVEVVWSVAPALVFDIADAELDLDTSPAYAPSVTVTVRALHDDTRIYLLYEVVDDVVHASSPNLRNDDGVGLFLDGAGDRSGPVGADDHALIVSAGASYFDYTGNDLEVDGAIIQSVDGYRGEIVLDKSEVGGVGASGVVGFNLALIDNDDVGNAAREAFALWRDPPGPHCTDCCDGAPMPWCDTTMLDTLLLEAP